MPIWIRIGFYGLLLVIALVAFLNSSITEFSESDWKNIFFSTTSLIFAIVIFDGALYVYEWKKKERLKQRLALVLHPIFRRMHELWFTMAYHSMNGIMGENRDVFSEEYKIEVCKYLNLECDAPVLGEISWRQYLLSSFNSFEKELNEINVLAFSSDWEELQDLISSYLNSGFNQNIRKYLYSAFSIPGGLEKHPYLGVLGHWGIICLDDYIEFLSKLNQLLGLENFDFYQHERLESIHESNGFGKCRTPDILVRNI